MFAADQMIINLSIKIGEVDSGSARLLCVAMRRLVSLQNESPEKRKRTRMEARVVLNHEFRDL